jgi:hypothetical protein
LRKPSSSFLSPRRRRPSALYLLLPGPPKKAAAQNDDHDDHAPPLLPKVYNLNDLPKLKFNLKDRKGVYSNNKTCGAGGSLE